MLPSGHRRTQADSDLERAEPVATYDPAMSGAPANHQLSTRGAWPERPGGESAESGRHERQRADRDRPRRDRRQRPGCGDRVLRADLRLHRRAPRGGGAGRGRGGAAQGRRLVRAAAHPDPGRLAGRQVPREARARGSTTSATASRTAPRRWRGSRPRAIASSTTRPGRAAGARRWRSSTRRPRSAPSSSWSRSTERLPIPSPCRRSRPAPQTPDGPGRPSGDAEIHHVPAGGILVCGRPDRRGTPIRELPAG